MRPRQLANIIDIPHSNLILLLVNDLKGTGFGFGGEIRQNIGDLENPFREICHHLVFLLSALLLLLKLAR